MTERTLTLQEAMNLTADEVKSISYQGTVIPTEGEDVGELISALVGAEGSNLAFVLSGTELEI